MAQESEEQGIITLQHCYRTWDAIRRSYTGLKMMLIEIICDSPARLQRYLIWSLNFENFILQAPELSSELVIQIFALSGHSGAWCSLFRRLRCWILSERHDMKCGSVALLLWQILKASLLPTTDAISLPFKDANICVALLWRFSGELTKGGKPNLAVFPIQLKVCHRLSASFLQLPPI